MAIRNDLKMQKGKVAAQCGHASVAAYRKAMETDVKLLASWLQFGNNSINVIHNKQLITVLISLQVVQK